MYIENKIEVCLNLIYNNTNLVDINGSASNNSSPLKLTVALQLKQTNKQNCIPLFIENQKKIKKICNIENIKQIGK